MTPAATGATLFGSHFAECRIARGRFDQSRPTTRKKGNAKRERCASCVMISLRLRARALALAGRCAAAYAGCDPRVGMKLFLLPAGAYRELIIPNYLESMYLAKLPKSLHPPNNIMRQLKMKLPHRTVPELTRARVLPIRHMSAICFKPMSADRQCTPPGRDRSRHRGDAATQRALLPSSRAEPSFRATKFPRNSPFPDSDCAPFPHHDNYRFLE